MKRYYSDYVTHAMRMYLMQPDDASPATVSDMDACAAALVDMSDAEADIILSVYAAGDFPDCVRSAAAQCHEREKYVWSLVDDFGRKFARYRGII